MLDIGKKGINPEVVSDQIGRLTFTSELVRAIEHLLKSDIKFGTYNLSNGGDPASWADITRGIFRLAGYSNTVTDIPAAQYAKNKPDAATRPLNSTLDLSKIQATGFSPKDWKEDLKSYIKKELDQ
jgi:dTDP-4-dehydrorhamnose 3,5-epimerase